MNRDDQDAALAHEQELEQRRREEDEMLGSAEYMKWLTNLYSEKVNTNEVPSESVR